MVVIRWSKNEVNKFTHVTLNIDTIIGNKVQDILLQKNYDLILQYKQPVVFKKKM